MEKSSLIFENNKAPAEGAGIDSEKLFSKIGKLEMENYFLKKLEKLGL